MTNPPKTADVAKVEQCELLPCPWCNAEATLANDGDPNFPIVIRDTHVEPCPLGFHSLQISYPNEETAAKAWNTRHQALSPARGEGWFDIASAPLDGTVVDLWVLAPDGRHGKRVPDAKYDTNRSFNGGIGRVAQPDAWVHADHRGEVYLDGGRFTHWRARPADPTLSEQPRPSAPTPKASEASGDRELWGPHCRKCDLDGLNHFGGCDYGEGIGVGDGHQSGHQLSRTSSDSKIAGTAGIDQSCIDQQSLCASVQMMRRARLAAMDGKQRFAIVDVLDIERVLTTFSASTNLPLGTVEAALSPAAPVSAEVVERLRALVSAVQGVLLWRVGELPDKGYIRDNDPSRTAIDAMAQALVDARASLSIDGETA